MSFQLQADKTLIVLRQIEETLLAVMYLHKPIQDKDNEVLLCTECTFLSPISVKYPCNTIQAIEKELKWDRV